MSTNHMRGSVMARWGGIPLTCMLIAIVGTFAPRADAATAKAGGTCPSRSVGTVTKDVKGQPLVCTKLSRTKFQWKLPALGSFLRPIPLGQAAAAGPAGHRFSVRVTRVNLDAASEVAAEFAESTPPPPAVRYVRVAVEASFLGPAVSGSTDHYWYARAGDGGQYPSSVGCGGGYGSDFDVTAIVAVRGVVAGTHCFELPAANVESLRLRVEGSDLADTYFALR